MLKMFTIGLDIFQMYSKQILAHILYVPVYVRHFKMNDFCVLLCVIFFLTDLSF